MSASRVILASASPRRRELIQRLGLPVTIRPADLDEDALTAAYLASDAPPEGLAVVLAAAKAQHMAQVLRAAGATDDEAIVLGADTTVILDGALLGKPHDAEEAAWMLSRLRGQTHTVVTGIAAVALATDQLVTRSVATPVTMRDFSDAEMAAYIATGDPFDKAGAYALQHPIFQPVAHIDGCATGVIGLPLCAVAAVLAELRVAYVQPTRPAGAVCRWDSRCTRAPAAE